MQVLSIGYCGLYDYVISSGFCLFVFCCPPPGVVGGREALPAQLWYRQPTLGSCAPVAALLRPACKAWVTAEVCFCHSSVQVALKRLCRGR